MALDPGALVSGYRIDRVLGAGGMGTVYLADNPVLPRKDALKVLSAEYSLDAQFRARFQQEADLAAGLDHPNIVTVYNRGESETGQLWIAMQYVAGSDAHKELDTGSMTASRAVRIIAEVAKALDYAHRRGLIHRDIKPANFLLAPDSHDDERVLLADFGIARLRDAGSHLTATGAVVATVAYAAPEALSGADIDHRVDVYALGCALYRMLTGKTPFGGTGNAATVIAAHLSAPPPQPTLDRPDLPAAFDDVIATAMAKDPARRYQSAGALAAAAVAALGGATPSSAATQEGPTERVYPRQQPTGQMTSAQVHSSTPYSVTMPQPFGPPLAATAPQAATHGAVARRNDPGRRRFVLAAAAAVMVVAIAVTGVLLWPTDSQQAYQAQTFSNIYGQTQISARPQAPAALGAGDADAAVSLGATPSIVALANAVVPGWMEKKLANKPKVVPAITAEAVSAAKPDAIIATSDITDAVYQALSAIAPTVARPSDHPGPGWSWQDQLTWTARVLGRDDQAQRLIDQADQRHSTIRKEHPAFANVTLAVVNNTDDGVSAYFDDSRIATYLRDIGFSYSQGLRRKEGETGDTRAGTDLLMPSFIGSPTALIVVRADQKAGKGSYEGLPSGFPLFQGPIIIVDTPDLIAAINPGGYSASEYLDTALVTALAQQIK
ncbi:serine/threonine-protein kinase [Mycobacteroides abscessus]|uniref:serine/threonine-protein kinase n=1 Tax=Mycobacteroides abscessus TaxID=36809 RepID=UPI000C255EFE|nr:serine/threonine-protein kinase [Mycobacteroides abscessus]